MFKLNLKILKNVFALFLGMLFLVLFFTGLNISYNPNHFAWVMACVLYLILAITFFSLVYLKKNSKIYYKRIRELSLQQGQSEEVIRTIGFVYVLFLPATLIYMFNAYVALACNFLAKQSFSERVSIETVDCDYSRRGHSKLSFAVVNAKGDNYTVDFSYSMCRDYPNIQNLNGHSIELYGRQWVLGTIYDGFYYPQNIDIS